MTDLKTQVEAAVMARGGKKQGSEIRFKCPSHDDHNSADYNPVKAVWICRACGESGNYWHLGVLLGVINNGHRGDGFRETRRWDIGGMATHKRLERNGAKKVVEWERQGKAGLDGLPTADLPLYAAELPIEADADVLLSEGEKATDALLALGFAALGTITGATGTPSTESLKPLAEHTGRVFLCRDNDQGGHHHMTRIASRLKVMGKESYLVAWPGVSEKGDAYDYIASGHTADDVRAVLEAAEPYQGQPEPEDANKKDTEGEVKGVSFAIVTDCLYEQIYTNEQSAFVEYNINTGEVKTVPHIMQGETKIIPQQGEELTLAAIKLPTGVTEYADTLPFLREIEAHIVKYLDVSDAFRKFAAYYILLSWLYDKFSTLPYLRAIGDTGCGKSRALDVIGLLCYKPTLVSGCITPAPIYRMLKRWNGTMILDEADLQNSDEYSEVVKILNCGFERGRPVIRATKDNPDKLQFLPTFGPKVFATRRRFKDPALEARCLTEIMQETTRDDIPATLTSTFYKEQEVLRNKLLLFRLRNYNRVNPEEAISLDLKGIEPRLRQISACFASLFAEQPEVLADYHAFIEYHQRELIEQRAATPMGQVVEKLFTLTESVSLVTNVTDVTGGKLIPISSQDIATPLGMTPQAVGQILKTLGLQTKVHKVEGASKRCIVYDAVKLNTLKKRYIPSEDDQVTMVTTVTGLNADGETPPLLPGNCWTARTAAVTSGNIHRMANWYVRVGISLRAVSNDN